MWSRSWRTSEGRRRRVAVGGVGHAQGEGSGEVGQALGVVRGEGGAGGEAGGGRQAGDVGGPPRRETGVGRIVTGEEVAGEPVEDVPVEQGRRTTGQDGQPVQGEIGGRTDEYLKSQGGPAVAGALGD